MKLQDKNVRPIVNFGNQYMARSIFRIVIIICKKNYKLNNLSYKYNGSKLLQYITLRYCKPIIIYIIYIETRAKVLVFAAN